MENIGAGADTGTPAMACVVDGRLSEDLSSEEFTDQ
jgi:hypothetical protein